MIRLYNCIVTEHDWRLVLLAALICFSASITASFILDQVKRTSGPRRISWIAAAAVVTGSAIWATHFVGMLAYNPGLEFQFVWFETIASLLIVIVIGAVSFRLLAVKEGRVAYFAGAALFGLGISVMHYVGMGGMLAAGYMSWDYGFVVASTLAGLIIPCIAFGLHRYKAGVVSRVGAGVLLALAVISMHFLGMAAITWVPSSSQEIITDGLSQSILGAIVSGFALFAVQTTLAATLLSAWLEKKKIAADLFNHKHESLLESIAEIAHIGSWELDLDTDELFWNKQTKTIHEVDASFAPDLVDAVSFFGEEDMTAFLGAVEEARHTGKPFRIELPLKTASGRELWVRIICNRIGGVGEAGKLVGVYQEVTDQVLERKTMTQEMEKRDSANRLKTEFLANMSHEIRTPLNGILGMAQILGRTPLNDKQRVYADRIKSCGDTLLALINDILDISKIEAGLMKLENEPFDIEELLQQAEDSVAGIAMGKGLSISHTCTMDGGTMFHGDAKRLRQILINFAGNAVKFTDEGSVQISAEQLPGGSIRFSVEDTGAGIPADQQALIFERFRQADGSATRKHGGTGLGLSISKDFIELMGGQLGIHSQEGQGSTFWFAVNLNPAEAEEDHVFEILSDDCISSTSHTCRILLAEDSPVNQEVIMAALSDDLDFDITIAENGAEAIDELENRSFDIVLMDINMPVMTGDEAIKRIRNSGRSYADIPIIVLTANALSEQQQYYMALGASAYLAKPIDIDGLIKEINKCRAQSRAEQAA